MQGRTRSRSSTYNRLTGGSSVQANGNGYIRPITWNGTTYYPDFRALVNALGKNISKGYNSSSTYNNEAETIVDMQGSTQPGVPLSRRKRIYKPCTHTKVKYHSGISHHVETNGTSSTATVYCSADLALPPGVVLSQAPLVSSGQLLTWREAGRAAIIPELKNSAGVSGFNFLLELKEFPRLKCLIRQTASDLASMLRYWYLNPRSRVDKQWILTGQERTSDWVLAYDFGLAPVVRDVANASALFRAVLEEIQRLNAKGKDISTHHYSSDVLVSNTYTTTLTETIVTVKSIHFHCQAFLTYWLKEAQSVMEHLDYAMAYYALGANPKRVWDALPFSFLVDYVLNVGQVLDSLDRGTRANVHVSTYIESTKQHCHVVKFRRSSGLGRILKWNYSPLDADIPQYLAGQLNRAGITSRAEATIYSRSVSSYMDTDFNPFYGAQWKISNPITSGRRLRDILALAYQFLGHRGR